MSGATEFVISRTFNAPRELVWRAWTEPAQLARWWGPHQFTATVPTLDLRVGGAYRYVMHGPDGMEYPMSGTFTEVVPPERLVMAIDLSDHPDWWFAQVMPEAVENHHLLDHVQTITFEEVGAQTRVTVTAHFATPEILACMAKLGMNEGWSQSLEKLTALLPALR